jgi:hypothetical protein
MMLEAYRIGGILDSNIDIAVANNRKQSACVQMPGSIIFRMLRKYHKPSSAARIKISTRMWIDLYH